MKKIIFIMIALVSMAISANSQNYANYRGSSKFTDNVSVTLGGGVVTPMEDFFSNGSTTPIVVLGVDKFINPWLGVGIQGRTSIGVGDKYNPHTAFDYVNVSTYLKLNVLNMIKFNGQRRVFEPLLFGGLGWGHANCSVVDDNYTRLGTSHTAINARNFMTARAGAELNFYFNSKKVKGEKSGWSLNVTPSVVWGDICNGRLDKRCGYFEVTAGVRYTFKSSNGRRVMDASPVAALVAENAALAKALDEARSTVKTVEVVKEVSSTATNAVSTAADVWTVAFELDSAKLTDAAKTTLNAIPTNIVVTVDGFASYEKKSNKKHNDALSAARAAVVADYLTARGVKVAETVGRGADATSARVAIVSLKK